MAKEKADFSIYLFQNGEPVKNAELFIDGEAYAEFSNNGSIFGTLTPGEHQFTINRGAKSFGFALPLRDQENVQIMLTFPDDNGNPLLVLDSNIEAGQESAQTQKKLEDLGEGIIKITVISAETQKPIKDVQVFLSGLSKRFRTDANGQLTATVPVNEYSLSLLHSAFNAQSKQQIKINKEQSTEISFQMTPAGVELAEYVVLEPYLAGTLASVIEEQRTSTSVSTVMGSEQISRNGDSDVASALKRASGLTVIGGKFVFIRGLGERYSSTLINGASIPSPDPTRRVVPLDLFPTAFLDSVLVQKSYSADRPGEFAGGTLEMRTKRIPEDFFFKFSGQVGFNEGTSFEQGQRYQGSDTDFLGFDNDFRKMPSALAATSEDGGAITVATRFNPEGYTPDELEPLGEELSNVWDITSEQLPPDGRIEFAIGDSFSVDDFEFGYLASARWKQEWNIQDEIRREFSSSGTDGSGKLVMTEEVDLQRTMREIQMNGYIALEAKFRENHRIFTNSMFLRQSEDEARFQEGFTDAEVNDIRRYQLRWYSNELFLQQVGGEHVFDFANDLKVDWIYTNATAKRDEPNRRDYRYDENDDGSYSFSRRADSNLISFGELRDEDESWRLDVKLPLQFDDVKLSLNGGFIDQEKQRNSSIRRYNFATVGSDGRDPELLAEQSLETVFSDDNISSSGFQLRETTRPTDNYVAKQSLLSYYGQGELTLFDRVRFTGGLRWEDNEQRVETFKITGKTRETIVSTLQKLDMLPEASATWFISENQQLRFGYSETISRPDFRELSPAPFTDPSTNLETTGNPELKQTSVLNYDVRWEYYISNTENFSAGFFWKDLTTPIEKVFLAGTAGLLTYQNTEAANIYGFEFEFLKNLDIFSPKLENFYIGGNYTWSECTVELTAEKVEVQTANTGRGLQGHSPHVFNVQIGYDNSDWGTRATLLYNVAAERIVSVGLLGAPDKYEQAFNQLDFVASQQVNDWFSVKIKAKNLWDDTVKVTQGQEVTRAYRRGRDFSISFNVNF